jgi:choline/glycine/proline betaine transport protein
MAILVALPFSIVMVLMVFATSKALMAEQRAIKRSREHALAERIVDHVNGDAELSPNGNGSRADTAPVGTR